MSRGNNLFMFSLRSGLRLGRNCGKGVFCPRKDTTPRTRCQGQKTAMRTSREKDDETPTWAHTVGRLQSRFGRSAGRDDDDPGGSGPEKVPDRAADDRGSGKLFHRRRAEGHQPCDAAAAPAPGGARRRARSPTRSPSARCTCSSRFPRRNTRADGPSSWCTDRVIRARAWNRRRTAAKAGIPTSFARACRATSSIRPGADAPGSMSRSSTREKPTSSPATSAAERP